MLTISRTAHIPFILFAVLGLSACATKNTLPLMIEPAPQTPIIELTTYPPVSLGMESCRSIFVETEVFDFTSEEETSKMVRFELFPEFPQTRTENARGMQHRTDIPSTAAMIFEFNGDHNPVLWMKDVQESLDMIWIDENTNVFYIEHNTPAFSETFLSPEDSKPVGKWVLQIPAGSADRYKISPGLTTIKPGPVVPCTTIKPEAIT
jgi:uncharacterized membrane protein (UPF0127 family)